MIYILLFILNILLFFSLKKISQIINIFDCPDGKLKLHKKPIPILGGFLLFLNLILIFYVQISFLNNFLIFEKNLFPKREILSLLLYIVIFFVIGLYDDKYTINPYTKLFLIIFSSIFVLSINKNLIVDNFFLSFYENKIFLNDFSFFFTIFCIVILINALNFYDGVNGQSGIFHIFIFSFLYSISENNFYLILVLILIYLSILNLTNKLFFGDSGIYLIGSILIICLIYEHNVIGNIIYADEIFFLLLFPGIDLVRLTIERLLNNKNIFYGDRNHYHHHVNKKFNLTISNLVLLILNAFPIVFFKLGLNFYYVLLSFLVIYFTTLFYFKRFKKKIS